MKELLRSNDPVRLSWAMAVLHDADIPAVIFDAHAAIVEGSISAIERRIMVDDDDYNRAKWLLDAAIAGLD